MFRLDLNWVGFSYVIELIRSAEIIPIYRGHTGKTLYKKLSLA